MRTSGDGNLSWAAQRHNTSDAAHVFPEIVSELARTGRPHAAFDFIERTRARLIAERRLRSVALEPDSSAAVRALRGGPNEAPAVSAAELQRMLAVDEAFVSFMQGNEGVATTAIVVTRDKVLARHAPIRNDLASDIERFAQLAANGTEAVDIAARLGSVLMAPIIQAVGPGIRRFIISPDGDLHRLPFDALRLPDGRRVIDQATVSIVPSATVYIALRANPQRDGNRVVVVADPAYSPTSVVSGDSLIAHSLSDVALPRLAYSADEAARVARYAVRSQRLTRQQASARRVSSLDLSDVAVLHFATHAVVDDWSEQGTALALAPDGTVDGFLDTGELAQLDIQGALVVLSACRSASGVVLKGEGLRGLTAPLLSAGARAVVGTYWAIADRRVVPFIDRFYRAMAEGTRPDDALRNAKLAAIRDGVSIAEWGSFVLTGDGSQAPPLRRVTGAPVPWVRAAGGTRAPVP
jgi:CHAT domain-containing protein